MPKDRRLETLLEYHERAASALRTALELINTGASFLYKANGQYRTLPGANGNGARPGGDRRSPAAIQKQAARLDAARATAVRQADVIATRHTGPKKRRSFTGRIQTQRAASARLLDQFDRDDPKRPIDVRGKARGVGSLVRRGYLAKKGGGYVRTDKPFSINPNA